MTIRVPAGAILGTLMGVALCPGQTDASKSARPVPTAEPAKTAVEKTAMPSYGKDSPMRVVASEDAPKAAGPYSQAVVAGGFLFAAGQVNRDPKTGQLVAGSIEAAAERVLDNLEAVLKADGLTWADVVKTTVYLTKADDFAPLNGVYGKRMGEAKPARSTVVVAGLPGGAMLEIDLVARARR